MRHANGNGGGTRKAAVAAMRATRPIATAGLQESAERDAVCRNEERRIEDAKRREVEARWTAEAGRFVWDFFGLNGSGPPTPRLRDTSGWSSPGHAKPWVWELDVDGYHLVVTAERRDEIVWRLYRWDRERGPETEVPWITGAELHPLERSADLLEPRHEPDPLSALHAAEDVIQRGVLSANGGQVG